MHFNVKTLVYTVYFIIFACLIPIVFIEYIEYAGFLYKTDIFTLW